jgi:hypothetical protein
MKLKILTFKYVGFGFNIEFTLHSFKQSKIMCACVCVCVYYIY